MAEGGAISARNLILTAGNEAAFFGSRQTTIKAVLLYAFLLISCPCLPLPPLCLLVFTRLARSPARVLRFLTRAPTLSFLQHQKD